MAVIEYIRSKNGAENIDISRQKTNESNLMEAKKLWSKIIDIDEDKYPDYHNFQSSNSDLITLVKKTIPSRIKKNFIHFGIDSPEDISWKLIKRMAKEYLNANPWLQISFCKDSTRQSVDERVQRAMLNSHLNGLNYKFKKCSPSKTVYEGELLSRKDYYKLDPRKTRKDIDTYGSKYNRNIWIFQKYAKASGGHQDNVITETQHFLEDADKFIANNNNNNNNYFIAQLDGKFIEENIVSLKSHITNTPYVFAGNSYDVINWIKDI